MAGERSRSETVQTQHRHTASCFNICFFFFFFCAARAEKAAGHHRAPPAEADSVCHVQQQQVVPHTSSSYVPTLPSGIPQRNAAKRIHSTRYPHHLGTPPTTTLHPVLVQRSHPSPLICHLVRSPQQSYATAAAAKYNRCST